MGREFEGQLDGRGTRVAIVAARFNELITSQLVAGARDCLRRHGVRDEDQDLAWVPGSPPRGGGTGLGSPPGPRTPAASP